MYIRARKAREIFFYPLLVPTIDGSQVCGIQNSRFFLIFFGQKKKLSEKIWKEFSYEEQKYFLSFSHEKPQKYVFFSIFNDFFFFFQIFTF